MKSVSRFEADLLRVTRAVLKKDPLDPALAIIRQAQPRPSCLGRDAVDLVRDALGKGSMLLLARAGWRRERFAREGGERVDEGRLWQRREPKDLGLAFTARSMELLLTLTSARPEDAKAWERLGAAEAGAGDQLLAYWIYGLLAEADCAGDLAGHAAFADNPLCQLAYPHHFAGTSGGSAADLGAWAAPERSWIIETLQPALADGWTEAERSKGEVRDWQRLRILGDFQGEVLDSWLAALGLRSRRDLARFLLVAGRRLLLADDGPPEPARWIGKLHLDGLRLADRTVAYQAALAMVRRFERLKGWEQWARGVGYFDEGYAAAQLWLSDWERLEGEAVHARAQQLIARLDPLAIGTPEGGPGDDSPRDPVSVTREASS